MATTDDVFSTGDPLKLGRYDAERGTAGAAADWSAPARNPGVVVHGDRRPRRGLRVRTGLFLAARRTDRYPDMPIFTAGTDATVTQLVESLEVMCRLVVDVVDGAASDVRAVLFSGTEPTLGAPAVPRAGSN